MSIVIDRDEYIEKLHAVIDLYSAGELDYRPKSEKGRVGGLIELKLDIPTIVVPDLHGRYQFIEKLLSLSINGQTVVELLSKSVIQIVCVGDAFHSESRGKSRWLECHKEYNDDFKTHEKIDDEMYENLKTMEYIMELKLLFPRYFHFLKGNHENIKNQESGGDYPFGKYTNEGEIVKSWVTEFLGRDFLESYAQMERLFPIMAIGKALIISHSLPSEVFSREDVKNYHNSDDLIHDFIWNRPGSEPKDVVQGYFREYLGDDNGLYVIGHTPVRGPGDYQVNNSFVKIHNPDNMYVLYHNSETGSNRIIDLNGDSSEDT